MKNTKNNTKIFVITISIDRGVPQNKKYLVEGLQGFWSSKGHPNRQQFSLKHQHIVLRV